MALTLVGALLMLGGLLLLVALPIWRGLLSDIRRTSAASPEPTLEPPKAGAGFYSKENFAAAIRAVAETVSIVQATTPGMNIIESILSPFHRYPELAPLRS